MRKLMTTAVVLTACFGLTGCFDVEQSLVLEKDLSGKAGFTMTVDMEPMVVMMAHMKHAMEGKEGEPSKAEIDATRKEMMESKKSEGPSEVTAEDKAEFTKQLPPGVKLIDLGVKEDGLKMKVNLLLGFDNVAKLESIRLPEKEGAAPGEGGGNNPFSEPFADLKITDEGETLLLTSKAVNPAAEQQESMPEMSPEEEKQVQEMFKGLRIAWKIEAPFEVVETNATRRQGKTLYWEYDFKTLSKMKPEELAQGVRVRFKK